MIADSDSKSEFKSKDKVKMYIDNSQYKDEESYYAYGEITIISEQGIKVIFIEDLDYAYYNKEDLELVTEQEFRRHERTQHESHS